jgi:hypothetical protein
VTAMDLARYFAHGFEMAKELAKTQPSEVAAFYEAVAAHLRSAAPLALVGPAPLVPDGSSDALIDLGAGALVRLRVLDGQLNMYVCEAAQHDVNVVLEERAREQLRAALGVVR